MIGQLVAFVGTIGGKICVGTTVVAASYGGAVAADVVEVPFVEDEPAHVETIEPEPELMPPPSPTRLPSRRQRTSPRGRGGREGAARRSGSRGTARRGGSPTREGTLEKERLEAERLAEEEAEKEVRAKKAEEEASKEEAPRRKLLRPLPRRPPRRKSRSRR